MISHVPALALLLSNEGCNWELQSLISSHLLPMVAKALTDENVMVRI